MRCGTTYSTPVPLAAQEMSKGDDCRVVTAVPIFSSTGAQSLLRSCKGLSAGRQGRPILLADQQCAFISTFDTHPGRPSRMLLEVCHNL